MQCHPVAGDRINLYGLVSYLPHPLGSFLDEIRRELVPSCFAQSHLSVLPPRALAFDEAHAQQQLAEAVQDLAPFQVELRDVEIFDKTFVIYLGIGRGSDELRRMHERLNFKYLASPEIHSFHPHITLAQDFDFQELDRLVGLARKMWAAFPHRRWFDVERLTFVQNTSTKQWVDLAEFPLGSRNGQGAASTQTS
jgi:2'-5' RNA ligase